MIFIRYDDFGVRMAKTDKKENKVRLFNINGHVGQDTQQNIIVANSDLNIPTREIKYNIQNGKLNKGNIISEMDVTG
jgi:hypothetical protein